MNFTNGILLNESCDETPSQTLLESGNRNLSAYVSAAEMFRSSAARFIQHLHHLVQARDLFQQAITASAELRVKLDAGDNNLQKLMTQMEHELDIPTRKPSPDEQEADTVEQEFAERRSVQKRFL
jgi:hypothetical protein